MEDAENGTVDHSDQNPFQDGASLGSEPFSEVTEPPIVVNPPPITDSMDDDEPTLNHHSLPDPEELKVNTPVHSSSSSSTFCRGCRGWTIFGILFILLNCIIIGLSAGLTKDNRSGSGQTTWNNFHTRETSMQKYVIDQRVSNEEDFRSASSPQSKAIQWLANEDMRQLDIPSASINTAAGYSFVTRYVMTVLYFATGGESWNYDLLFLSEHDTCDWFQIFPGAIGELGVLCDPNIKTILGVSFIANNLQGSLPDELSALTSLVYLESIGNGLEGNLPRTYNKLTNMRTTVLAHNAFSGAIPDWIDEWKDLEVLYLSNNFLTGNVPSALTKLKSLSILALDDNMLGGTVDFGWEFPNLEVLFLEDNDFSGGFPTSLLEKTPLLAELDLSSNNLVGFIPADIFQLKQLEIVDLHGNGFYGGIPTAVTDVSQLQFLALYENELSSSIPTQIGLLKNLKHLDLSSNAFTGLFPSELDGLNKLTYLFLANNFFIPQDIPVWMYTFENLKELSLKKTKLTGSISTMIGFLKKLVLLDLNNNDLNGSIPTQIGQLTDLQFLLLNINSLTGQAPQQMGNLESLRMMLLEGNEIIGSVSDTACRIKSLTVARADCQEVSCECCDPCCTDGVSCGSENDIVANLDPVWERGYDRQFSDFSNMTGNDLTFAPGDDDLVVEQGSP